jgi:Na+/citrate or Na+/malate symporter
VKAMAAAFHLILLIAAAQATTVVPMSVEELTEAATSVVEAQADDSWSQWNAQHTTIYTYTRVTVLRTLKGPAVPAFVVKQLGGIVAGVGQTVPGVRRFIPGESVLLFLRPSAAGDGTQIVVGLMQGHFRIYRARGGFLAVTNGLPGHAANGVSALRRGAIADYRGTTMALDELESRVLRRVR